MTFPNYTPSPQLPVLLVSFFFPASSSHTWLYLFIFIYYFSEFMQAVTSGLCSWLQYHDMPRRCVPHHSDYTNFFLTFFHDGLWSGWQIYSIWGPNTPLSYIYQDFNLLWIPALTIAYCWKVLLSLRLTVVLVCGYNHACLDGRSTTYLFDLTSVVEIP